MWAKYITHYYMRNACRVSSENLKGRRYHSRNLHAGRLIILKWILEKYDLATAAQPK
jgi:hypothetical protein